LELNFWAKSFSLFSIFDLSFLSGLLAWMIGILLELLILYTVEFIYHVAHQYMHFLFSILKIQKNRHFSLVGISVLESLSLA
jgi:hypothetical protein